jgi:hypothetical protein
MTYVTKLHRTIGIFAFSTAPRIGGGVGRA